MTLLLLMTVLTLAVVSLVLYALSHEDRVLARDGAGNGRGLDGRLGRSRSGVGSGH